jgi:ribosomal protein L13E
MDVKLNLSNTEHKDLLAYCNLNDLLISSVVKDSFTTGFNIERYGLLNAGIEEKQVVKEVIVEKRVEVPVEVIKEIVKIEYVEVEKPVEVIREVTVEKVVEVTKEVPVEKVVIQEVVKEVVVEKVVEKIIKVSDDTQVNELLLKIQQLENTPPKVVEVIKEVEKIVEVPVEVVKEIIIEKEGDSNLKPKMDALQNTVQKLKLDNIEKDKLIKEYEKTIEDIQKFQNETKAMYLKGSNLDNKLYK